MTPRIRTAVLALVLVSTAARCDGRHLAPLAALLDLGPVDITDPVALELAADAWCINGLLIVDQVGPEAIDAMPDAPLPPCTVAELLAAAAAEFGVDPALLDRITWCESRHRPDAVNPTSGAAGLAQFIPSTWRSTTSTMSVTWPEMSGESPLDPDANARAAAWLLAQVGTRPWNASRHCWGP